MRITSALAGVGIALAAQTASAQAQAFPANPQKLLPTAHFEGTNGYEVTVSGGRDSILLTASTSADTHYRTEPGSRVTYLVTTRRTRRARLVGSFGDAGSIRMEFDGRGRPRDHRLPGCDGTYPLESRLREFRSSRARPGRATSPWSSPGSELFR